MSYHSLNFFVFAGIILVFYYLVPGKFQKYILLLSNIVFYASFNVQYFPFLISTLFVTYLGGLSIGKLYEKEKKELSMCSVPAEKKFVRAKFKKKARLILTFSLAIVVVLLILCKYTKFILKTIDCVFDTSNADVLKIIIPTGISFYTFMAIGYILDVFWKRYSYEKSLINYAVFLTYFPHIVQGPIDRYNKFKSQLPINNKLKFDSTTVVSGAQLVVWGLFKKLVIADRLNIFVNSVYDNYENYYGIIFVVATIFYSIQIYADFSGCIDIVSGVSEMFGIKLKQNFNHPYFSKTIPEFWRRWHISLGDWFTDYIYYPASISKPLKKIKKNCKNKKIAGIITSSFPILVVWTITGIWHGASWKYVAWGLYYATIMVAGVAFADVNTWLNKKLKINTGTFSWQLWQILRTFTICTVGRVFFRAPRFRASLSIFKRILTEFDIQNVLGDAIYNYGLDRDNITLVFFSITVLLVVDILQEKIRVREKINQQGIVFRWLIFLIGVFAVMIFGIYGPGYDAGSFIYEQF